MTTSRERAADATVRWVESVTAKRVDRTARLVGGMSSDVHRCWAEDGTSFVVRHITNRGWLEREPDLITHEARALELLVDSPIAAPRLLAADPSADRLLMSFVEGSVIADADGLTPRVQTMAETAAAIAAVPLPADHGLQPWRSWAPADLAPPAWGNAELWQMGIDAFLGRTPQPDERGPVLLHRDLHPLNLLWDGAAVSGVVDWVNACVGPPHAELGHCRWNLAVLVGADAADDAFLEHYLESSGGPAYDHWWDLAPLMSFVDGPIGLSGWHAVGRTDLTQESVVRATELFLAAALESI